MGSPEPDDGSRSEAIGADIVPESVVDARDKDPTGVRKADSNATSVRLFQKDRFSTIETTKRHRIHAGRSITPVHHRVVIP